MIKYLLKTTEEYRLETVEDVKAFHKKLQQDAIDQGYTLSSFGYTQKSTTARGEIIDEWCVVKVIKIFQKDKEPETALNKITYEAFNRKEFDGD